MIVQPLLATYRVPLYSGLCKWFDRVVVLAAPANTETGFGDVGPTPFKRVKTSRIELLGNRLYFQRGVIRHFWKDRPDVVFAVADFRALHFWALVVLARLRRTPVYAHGQGVYDKMQRRSFPIYRLLLAVLVRNVTSYVCYTPSVRNELIACGFSGDKLSVMPNTIVNQHPVPAGEKIAEPGRLFFVGRLRQAVGLDLLFDAIAVLIEWGVSVSLDLVGDGEERARLELLAQHRNLPVRFHGAVHDDAEITRLSKACQIGVHPGDAGLSLVHYMSLSLVPVVHGSLEKHMGPEASYIVDCVNGAFFKRGDPVSLAKTLRKLIIDPALAQAFAAEAYATWVELSRPTMAEVLALIIDKSTLPHVQGSVAKNG